MDRAVGRVARGGVFASVVVLALPIVGSVDGGGVAGRVMAEHGPVPGAEVQLSRSSADPMLRALTDSAGKFAFAAVPAGDWVVQVRRLGYEAHSSAISVRDGEVTSLSVVLRAVAQRLDTVPVVARGDAPARYGPSSRMEEFYRRRARGRGRFFTREDIEASGRKKLPDLLRLVPGARVTTQPGGRAEVTFARCLGPVKLAEKGSVLAAARGETDARFSVAELYVNGTRVDAVSLRETLGSLDLGEVEAVEVYRGVSELPLEALGNTCAAIFVWTRFGPDERGRKIP